VAPLGVVLALTLVLAWWRPWAAEVPSRPQPVALVPTATPIVVPVATRTPEPEATAAATPARPVALPATPMMVATPAHGAPRAPGVLLYSGSVGGEAGIVAASADGRERELIVEGEYAQIAWSPAGDRFAAVGRLDERTQQVAIFAPDGRALARYPFAGGVERILWSPDGGVLACAVQPLAQNSASGSAPGDIWLISGEGEPQRVELPEHRRVVPLSWTDGRQVAIAGYDATSGEFALWVVSRTGRNVVRAASGTFLPLGVLADGNTALVAGGLVGDPASGGSLNVPRPRSRRLTCAPASDGRWSRPRTWGSASSDRPTGQHPAVSPPGRSPRMARPWR
jgi:dipeptidyl aminopeptidase/acylaminoacyl peptidase